MRLVTGRIIRKQRTRTLSFPATPSSLLLEMCIAEKEKASQQTQTKLELRKASVLPLLDSQWFWEPRKSPCVSGRSSFLERSEWRCLYKHFEGVEEVELGFTATSDVKRQALMKCVRCLK